VHPYECSDAGLNGCFPFKNACSGALAQKRHIVRSSRLFGKKRRAAVALRRTLKAQDWQIPQFAAQVLEEAIGDLLRINRAS
jgi:hypothetical protein